MLPCEQRQSDGIRNTKILDGQSLKRGKREIAWHTSYTIRNICLMGKIGLDCVELQGEGVLLVERSSRVC